jgi:hypothetical protein
LAADAAASEQRVADEILEDEIPATTKEADERAEPEQRQVEHGSELDQTALGFRAVCC